MQDGVRARTHINDRVRQLAFDEVDPPPKVPRQYRPRHRAEAMRARDALFVSQVTNRRIDTVLAHAALVHSSAR